VFLIASHESVHELCLTQQQLNQTSAQPNICSSRQPLNPTTAQPDNRSTRQAGSSANSLHGIDIVPSPPPHRSSAPSLGEGVRVSRSSVRHGNDGLTVVLVSLAAESSLGGAEIGCLRSHAAVDFHRAKPLPRSRWYDRPSRAFDARFLISRKLVTTHA